MRAVTIAGCAESIADTRAYAFARKRNIEALALIYTGRGSLVTALYDHGFKTKPMRDFRQCRSFAEAEAWLKSKAGTMARFTRPLSGDDVRVIVEAWEEPPCLKKGKRK